MVRAFALCLLCSFGLLSSGCTVMSVASAAVSVASTAVSVTAKTVEVAADITAAGVRAATRDSQDVPQVPQP
ncbi:MAG: hypothetical protein RLZZ182_1640 [Pseudomonadota bacterium]|jgi:hypothetical protein